MKNVNNYIFTDTTKACKFSSNVQLKIHIYMFTDTKSILMLSGLLCPLKT